MMSMKKPLGMSQPLEHRNIGVSHGEWGESVAVAFLRQKGYEIIARNVRPCRRDRRLELDIVAYERGSQVLVFVEVKQHADHVDDESRIRGIDRRKLKNLRRAATCWRLSNRWSGPYRFDVVEVYGVPEYGSVEIDHIERVALFTDKKVFVDWS
jgi:putative endonuclease